MEIIDLAATLATEEKFSPKAYECVGFDGDYKFTEEAQDFYNETFDAIESSLINEVGVISDEIIN